MLQQIHTHTERFQDIHTSSNRRKKKQDSRSPFLNPQGYFYTTLFTRKIDYKKNLFFLLFSEFQQRSGETTSMARSNALPIPLFREQTNPQWSADRGGMQKEQRPPYKPAKESFQGPAQRRDKPGSLLGRIQNLRV